MKTKLLHKLLIGMVVATSAFPIMATAPDAVQEIIGSESKATQNKIMSTATDRNNVYLYVKAEGNKIYDVGCTIGGVECGAIMQEPISEIKIPMKTLVIINNSEDISEKKQAKIEKFVSGLVEDKQDNELIRIATYDTKVSFLTDYERDLKKLEEGLSGIEYNAEKSYLADALNDFVDNKFEVDLESYQRVIVISGDIKYKDDGVSPETLLGKIQDTGVPVYVLDCSSNLNEDEDSEDVSELKQLADNTSGTYYLMSEYESVSEIVKDLADDRKQIKVTLQPGPLTEQKKMQLAVLTYKGTPDPQGDTVVLKAQVKMPQNIVLYTSEEKEEEKVKQKEEEKEQAEDIIKIVIYIAIGAAVIAIGAKGIKTVLRKKNNEDEDMLDVSLATQKRPLQKVAKRYLILTDVNNQNNVFKAEITGPIIIGRSAEATIKIDYDKSISGKHCEIILTPVNKLIIKDLQSSNGTFVRGQRVVTQVEIASGEIVQLGRVGFKVEVQ